MIATAKNITNSITHLFFPHVCAGCGSDILHKDQLLCLQCIEQLPVTQFQLHAGNPVEKIFWGRMPVAAAASYLYFTKNSLLQHLMHGFKYKGNKEIGLFLGEQMGKAFAAANRFTHADALIPLPLFARRERKRGYNQAAVLCEGMASAMKIPVWKDAVARITSTETQTHKNREERWQNIKEKFKIVSAQKIKNRHLLLVDDVITTGATLEACATELLQSGAATLSIGTLAYTSK